MQLLKHIFILLLLVITCSVSYAGTELPSNKVIIASAPITQNVILQKQYTTNFFNFYQTTFKKSSDCFLRKFIRKSHKPVEKWANYTAFGSPMPGRQFNGNSYPMGFNGKRKDDEIKGNGNSYDFDARMLDTRLGRWLSRDPKSAKYPSQSPYHFGYNNPIITIDPNGEENIVVVGGFDLSGKDKFKFINTALKKTAELSKTQDKETTTIVLFTAGMTGKQIREVYFKALSIGENVNIVQVNNADQLNNYLNSKTVGGKDLSDARKNDKVTDMAFYGHGYAPGRVRNTYSTFEPGHGVYHPISAEHDKQTWGVDHVNKLNSEAFDKTNTCIESCNSATPTDDGESLTKAVSAKTKGTASGWLGKVEYLYIYEGGLFSWFTDKNEIKISDNYPSAGKTDDRKNESKKVTYINGKEVN